MAINDVLSVFRESIASERQARLGEMRLALSALQFESEREFRESGRQRENALMALQDAKQRTNEAVAEDVGSVVSSLSGLLDFSDGGELYRFEKQKRLSESGLSEKDQMDVYSIMNMYSSDSEGMRKLGEQAAKNFSRRFANEYKVWAESGFSDEKKAGKFVYKSALIQGLENSGVIYKGEDDVSRKISVESFVMIPEALDALDKISEEVQEIGAGDYEIQRDLSFDDSEYYDRTQDVGALADLYEDLPNGGPGSSLEEYRLSKEETVEKARVDINTLSNEISLLENEKKDVSFFRKAGEITKSQSDSLIKQLSQDIKSKKKELMALEKVEVEALSSARKAGGELSQREFQKQFEIASEVSSGLRF